MLLLTGILSFMAGVFMPHAPVYRKIHAEYVRRVKRYNKSIFWLKLENDELRSLVKTLSND